MQSLERDNLLFLLHQGCLFDFNLAFSSHLQNISNISSKYVMTFLKHTVLLPNIQKHFQSQQLQHWKNMFNLFNLLNLFNSTYIETVLASLMLNLNNFKNILRMSPLLSLNFFV